MNELPHIPTQAPAPSDRDAVAVDAFERLPEEVRAQIRVRRRGIRKRDEGTWVARRRDRVCWSVGVAVGTFVAAQLLPYPMWSKVIVAVSSAVCTYVVMLKERGRITSAVLFLSQAGVCCAFLTRFGAYPQMDLVMVFGFIVLQMVFGVLLGMKVEGLLSA